MSLQNCNPSPAEVKAELLGKINAEFTDTWTRRHLLALAEQVILTATIATDTGDLNNLQDHLMRPSAPELARFYQLLNPAQRTIFTWATFRILAPDSATAIWLATSASTAPGASQRSIEAAVERRNRTETNALTARHAALVAAEDALANERGDYETRILKLTTELAAARAQAERWERNSQQAWDQSARLQADLTAGADDRQKYARLQRALREIVNEVQS
jgi:hypothetical protein